VTTWVRRRRLRGRRARSAGGALALAFAAALSLAACSDTETAASDDGYHPAEVEEVAGTDHHVVRLTEDAAMRIGLETATAEEAGDLVAVPYAALIYDGEGATWVYVAESPRSFQRHSVAVDRVEGDQMFVSEGVAPGDQVATVGATEVYGAELGIDGSH
jgi:hypothetical protein